MPTLLAPYIHRMPATPGRAPSALTTGEIAVAPEGRVWLGGVGNAPILIAALASQLPTAVAAEGDWLTITDISADNTYARTTVGGLLSNRILTAPELRGAVEGAAALTSVNVNHAMGGITAGTLKRFTLAGSVTLTLPAVSLNNNTAVTLTIVLVQDATGGRSVTFAAPSGETIIWDGGGSQPAIATGAGQETTFEFLKIAGSTHWKGIRKHKGG